MPQPQRPEHRVVPLLRQEQLPAMAQAHVRLAVLVHVGGVAPGPAEPVEVESRALADVDEEPDIALAPVVFGLLAFNSSGGKGCSGLNALVWSCLAGIKNLPPHVLLRPADPPPVRLPSHRPVVLSLAADALAAEHVST